MPKKYIFTHNPNLQHNKEGNQPLLPVVTIHNGDMQKDYFKVEIDGPSHVVFSGEAHEYGPHVWVESEAVMFGYDEHGDYEVWG